jgi:phospholipid/cholesterol/gamma-HCH transport system permease protein
MPLSSPSLVVKRAVLAVQEYSLLSWHSLTNLLLRPLYGGDIMQQADVIGVGSIPIVVLTGFFTGAVLALQTSSSLQRFGAVSLTGQLVAFSMIKELGPVLTALMVSGRSASGMASELGSMKVTEQIDAMRALGTDPMKKLVTPRVIATVVMLFFLSIISDLFGLTGGWFISTTLLGRNTVEYWTSAYQSLTYRDIFMGLVKPPIFGLIIATIGCYYGMSTRGGTQGVGRSTTQAVVAASVLILVVDFFITRFLMVTMGM